MHSDVSLVGHVTGGVPAQEVHVAEDLLELLLLCGVVLSIDYHIVADAGEHQFKGIHYFYVTTLLLTDQSTVY